MDVVFVDADVLIHAVDTSFIDVDLVVSDGFIDGVELGPVAWFAAQQFITYYNIFVINLNK